MKGLLEFVVSVVLHPVAMVLAWINIVGRSDVGAVQKVVWGVVLINRVLNYQERSVRPHDKKSDCCAGGVRGLRGPVHIGPARVCATA